MKPTLKITKIPLFNSVVIKQFGAHHFISAPNSIVIGKKAYLIILKGLLEFEFITEQDLYKILGFEAHYENKENNNNSSIG